MHLDILYLHRIHGATRTTSYIFPSSSCDIHVHVHRSLAADLLLQQILEGLAVLGELLDALVELVERHAVLEERPPELGLVVDEGDLGDWGGGGCEKEVLVEVFEMVDVDRR
jgi:hypothetical protein